MPRLFRQGETSLTMERLSGSKVRDVLSAHSLPSVCPQIGRLVATIHNRGIIHGDLTTSNMILCRKRVCLIDFGLSFHSSRIEDKAVDLHLLRQALVSRHWRIADRAWGSIRRVYLREAKGAGEILVRLKSVDGRGRYKGK